MMTQEEMNEAIVNLALQLWQFQIQGNECSEIDDPQTPLSIETPQTQVSMETPLSIKKRQSPLSIKKSQTQLSIKKTQIPSSDLLWPLTIPYSNEINSNNTPQCLDCGIHAPVEEPIPEPMRYIPPNDVRPVRALTSRKQSQDDVITKKFKVPSWTHVTHVNGGSVISLKHLQKDVNVQIRVPRWGEEPCFILTGTYSAVGFAEKELLRALIRIDERLQASRQVPLYKRPQR